MNALRVAIVGAGLAGLAAGRTLRAAGKDVVLFDKGRRPGGRVATRRGDAGVFDHGAQFFTVREPAFAGQLADWQHRGIAAEWRGPFRTLQAGRFGPDPRPGQRRYCGVPGMSALGGDLARGLAVQNGTRVAVVRRHATGWLVATTDGARHGPFDELLLTLPPRQAAALLPPADPFAAELAAIELAPCCAVMVRFAEPVPDLAGGTFVVDDDLAWVAHDGGKPGRGGAPTYVLHGTAAFSRRSLGAAQETVGRMLVAALRRALARPLPAVAAATVHLWRYALPDEGAAAGERHDAARGLTAAGDFARGGRVEGAWTSGTAAAAAILALRTPGKPRP